METERLSYGGGVAHVAEAFSLMVQTVLVAEKSICWLLFLVNLYYIAVIIVSLQDLFYCDFPVTSLS